MIRHVKASGRIRNCHAWAIPFLLVFFLAVPSVLSGISLVFDTVSGSRSLSGAGTANASLSFGTISAFGAIPSGVDRVSGSSSYTLAADIGVRVEKQLLDLLTSSYTLRARLATSNSLSWTVGGIAMSTSYATVATRQSYGSTVPRRVGFIVPHSRSAGALSGQLEFLAIAD